MKLDFQKEITPVVYGDSSVKLLFFEKRMSGGTCFSTHWHDRMELLLITEGEILVELGERLATAKAKSLVIIPPGQPHFAKTVAGGVIYRVLMFELGNFLNGTPAAAKYLEPLINQKAAFVPVTDNPEIIKAAEALIVESESVSEGADIIIVGKVYELIGLLYRYCLTQKNSAAISDSRFQDVLDYVNQNFCEDISTAHLARRFGYDEAYFCRRFKAVTGLNPTLYIRILRLEQAQELIKEKKYSLSEIAERCGFMDAGYFARCFKKHFGITPSKFANSRDFY